MYQMLPECYAPSFGQPRLNQSYRLAELFLPLFSVHSSMYITRSYHFPADVTSILNRLSKYERHRSTSQKCNAITLACLLRQQCKISQLCHSKSIICYHHLSIGSPLLRSFFYEQVYVRKKKRGIRKVYLGSWVTSRSANRV